LSRPIILFFKDVKKQKQHKNKNIAIIEYNLKAINSILGQANAIKPV